MNAKKTKRFAVVVSIMLAASLIISGLTVFANTGVGSGTQPPEQPVIESAVTVETDDTAESSAETQGELPPDTSGETSEEKPPEIISETDPKETPTPEAKSDKVAAAPPSGSDVVLGDSSEKATVTITQPNFGPKYGDVLSVVKKDDGTAIASGDKVAIGTQVTLGVSGLPHGGIAIVAGEQRFPARGEMPFAVDYTVDKDVTVTAVVDVTTYALGDQSFRVGCKATHVSPLDNNNHIWTVYRTIDGTTSETNLIANQTSTVYSGVGTCSGYNLGTPAIAPSIILNLGFEVVTVTKDITINAAVNSITGVTIGSGGTLNYGNKTPNSLVTVNTGGTLSGGVITGTLTVSGGTVSGGTITPSTLSVTNGIINTPITAGSATINSKSGTGKITSTGALSITGTLTGADIQGATVTFAAGTTTSSVNIIPTAAITIPVGATVINNQGATFGSGSFPITVNGTLTTHGTVAASTLTVTGTMNGSTSASNTINVGNLEVSGGKVIYVGQTGNDGALNITATGNISVTGNGNIGASVNATTSTGQLTLNSGTIAGTVTAATLNVTSFVGTINGSVSITNNGTSKIDLLSPVSGSGTFTVGASVAVTVSKDHFGTNYRLNIVTSSGNVNVFGSAQSVNSGTGQILVASSDATTPTANGLAPDTGALPANSRGSVIGNVVTGNAGIPAIIINTTGEVAKNATVGALNGTVQYTQSGNKANRVEGNKVIIDANHTAGGASISSKTGTTINGFGTYDLVYAGGVLAPTDGSVTSPAIRDIGVLYAGSDLADVAMTSFTLDKWSVGALLVGGHGKNVTGPTTLSLTGAMNIGGNNKGTLASRGTANGDVFLGGTGGGSVGNVTYTVDDETISGSLYGGPASGLGSNGTVNIAIITGGTITGNLYGGGKSGSTGAVTISGTSGTISGAGGIYGGGTGGTVVSSDITLTADPLSNAAASVNGGGTGGNVTGQAHVNIHTSLDNNVFGGGTSGTTGRTLVEIGAFAVTGDVYGGGNGGGVINGVVVNIGGFVTGEVYGGGKSASVNTISGTVAVTVAASSSVSKNVHGGSYLGKAKDIKVDIIGTVTRDVYGGGHGTVGIAAASGDTTVTIVGKVDNDVYGGGETNASVTSTKVDLAATSTVGRSVYGGGNAANVTSERTHGSDAYGTYVVAAGYITAGDVYGGGNGGNVTKATYVDFKAAKTATAPFAGSVYGGGLNGSVGNTTVLIGTPIANGTDNHVYGGGNGGSASATNLTVDVTGDLFINVYGGGNGAITASTTVFIKNGDIKTNGGNVFGGGNGTSVAAPITTTTHVTFGDASGTPVPTLSGNIYGGSDTQGAVGGLATVIVNVDLAAGNTVYGGGKDTTTESTDVTVNKAVFENVYGGGEGGAVANQAKITIASTATVGVAPAPDYRNVYGGAKGASAGSTLVLVDGRVNGHVYGSGQLNGATASIGSTTDVTITGTVAAPAAADLIAGGDPQAQIAGNVYGGGDMPVNGSTKVTYTGAPTSTVEYIIGGGSGSYVGTTAGVGSSTWVIVNSGIVNQEVYGGSANIVNSPSYVGSTKVEIKGGTLNGNVHGGGFANATSMANTKVQANTEVTVSGGSFATDINVYGGGNGGPVDGIAKTKLTGTTHEFLGSNTVFGGGTDNFTPGTSTDTGSTEVTVENTHATNFPKTVFGGGENSHVKNTTNVAVKDGTIGEHVYGGGLNGAVKNDASAANTITVTIGTTGTTADITGMVYGGGFENRPNGLNPEPTKVTGNIELTIHPSSIITGTATGSVFGGGRNNKTDGNVTINFYGNITAGSLFGGGDNGNAVDIAGAAVANGVNNNAVVTGNTTVNVGGFGTAKLDAGSVYGGGNIENADVNGSTTIDMTGFYDISDNVFGGGYQSNVGKTTTIIASEATANDSIINGDVYGGGWADGATAIVGDFATDPTSTISIGIKKVLGSVYGGGLDGALTNGSTEITITTDGIVLQATYGGGRNDSEIKGNTHITVEGSTNTVFGGGWNNSPVKASGTLKGNTLIDVKGTVDSSLTPTLDYSGDVHGGGNNKSPIAGNAVITVHPTGDVNRDVYGGGITGTDAGATKSDVSGNTTITVNGNVARDVFGGGHTNSHILGAIGTTINVNKTVGRDVFGGGINDSNVTNNTLIVVDGAVATVGADVFGGGTSGVTKTPAGTLPSLVTGGTTITVSNKAKVGRDVFGGGLDRSHVTKDAKVTVTDDGTKVIRNVFGGGTSGLGTGAGATAGNGSNIGGGTFVTVQKKASVGSDVFGGGYDKSHVALNSDVKILSAAQVAKDVYGGGMIDSNVNGTTGATVLIDGTITRDVFGGGIHNSNIVNGATSVTITKANGLVKGDVYGGGINKSNVSKDANVFIHGTVESNVYGGGTKAGTGGAAGATVHFPVGTIIAYVDGSFIGGNTGVMVTGTVGKGTVGSVYGGGHTASPVNGYAVVSVDSGKVAANVFGGGTVDSPIKLLNSLNNGTTVTITGTGIIGNDVYGGGLTRSPISNTNASAKVLIDTKATVQGSVYGGGKDASPIAKATLVDIKGLVSAPTANTTTNNVFGAGWDNSNINQLNTVGGAVVTIHGSARISGNVFGGGRLKSEVKGLDGTRVAVMNGAIIGLGARAGETFAFSPIEANYQSYPTYQKVNDIYPHNGNVYGGGSAGGTTATSRADASNVSNPTGKGSYVHIAAGAQTSGVIYGGGFQSDIIGSNGGTNVLIEGRVTAVHGGGRQGTVGNATRDGAIVKVTGAKAFVRHDVYGGGYAETLNSDTEVRKTNVRIEKQANVGERVFGGGHNLGANIFETTTVNVDGVGTYIGNKLMLDGTNYPALINAVTGILGNEVKKAVEHDKFFEFYNRYTEIDDPGHLIAILAKDSFNALGQIYGGGNDAGVIGDITIDINNNEWNAGQKVYDRISGGNLGAGMASTPSQVRTINMNNFGVGDYTTEFTNADIPYTKLEDFAVVRFLQDYTAANIDNSFLTVYYNLKSFDDGVTLLGGAYGSAYTSLYNHNKGIYHPWRPEPNTNVRVEPAVHIINQAKLRLRSGYTISFDNGIFLDDKRPLPETISLLIDLASDEYVATTTKIYSEIPNNVRERDVFRYTELPRTLFPKNIMHLASKDIHGVNFYIPPRKVKPTGGNNSNSGGNGIVDRGTGSSSGGGFGGGFGGGGGGSAVKATTTIGTAEYLTSDKSLVKPETITQRVTEAIKKAGAGKTGYVVEKEAGQIAGDTLRSMVSTAKTAGGKVMYHADTVRKPNFVEGRMYIDPAKAANVKGVINTSVYTHQSKVAYSASLFSKFFKNKMAIVHLAQEGSFGMSVEVAAKVDLTGLNVDALLFYTYNIKTNAYSKIAQPNYFVDKNGYLHFTTTTGDEVIITDSELVRK